MTPVSRTSWRRSITSPVVSDPKPSFPCSSCAAGWARVPTALRPWDAHQVLPWESAGVIPPGPSQGAESFALCSRDAFARADPALTAVTGVVLSLLLRSESCPSPQRISAASSSSSLAGAASQFRSLSTQKGRSESVLPGLGSLRHAGIPAWCEVLALSRGPCTSPRSDSFSSLPSLNALDLMPQASTCSCSFFLPNYSS